jgi:hypothetical protein
MGGWKSVMNTLNTAVRSLCGVIDSAANPRWLIDATSGVKPEELASSMGGDVIVARPDSRVEMIEGLVSAEALNTAIISVSVFVSNKSGVSQ